MKSEIVVVGSGPGGAVTACLMAEAGRQVLLVEEGPALGQDSCRPFSVPEMRQKYRNGGLTAAMGRCKIPYVEGRVVGGGSEVNSGLYHRTPDAVLDDWERRFGLQGASVPEMRPHFEQCEKDLSVGPGPGRVPDPVAGLLAGARRAGLSGFEVPRMVAHLEAKNPSGVPRWQRRSMSRTYIPRALQAGGALLADTRILSLGSDGQDGWVLRGEGPKGPVEIAAGCVFLACGAVQTPALLRRSGLSGAAGRTLSLQPMLKAVAEFDGPVNSLRLGVPPHQVKGDSPPLSLGCSISSPPNLAMILAEHPEHVRALGGGWERMLAFYSMVSGSGNGSVAVVPGFRDPVVRYRVSDADLKGLSDGMTRLSELLFDAGARRVYPAIAGLGRLSARADVERVAPAVSRDTLRLITLHLMSSCPMGELPGASVVDSFGRVFGRKNLYVSDASILCGPLGVNPQGSIMAFARRNAMKFLGKL